MPKSSQIVFHSMNSSTWVRVGLWEHKEGVGEEESALCVYCGVAHTHTHG